MKTAHPLLTAGIALAAVVATLSAGSHSAFIWLHYLCKPLATLLILALAWKTAAPISLRYRKLIAAALILCACGDSFLMLPAEAYAYGFVSGLGSFLIAHLFFLRALSSDSTLFGKPLAPCVYGLLSALNVAILWDAIPAALHGPVLAYVGCLTAMAAQAASRALDLRNAGSRRAALGGALFLLSDTLIAYDRFHQPLPAAELWILGTYYLSIYLLARSVTQSAPIAASIVAPAPKKTPAG
ncbi:MAG: lysoplasmalogenase [Burkholderiaceae bacterium]|nr:lysoplasmalogenase [Burkholderiaceae bacterium]